MGDTNQRHPDYFGLVAIATSQSGYFTNRQASICGYSDSLLSHHVKTGKFRRVHRGVYRLRDFPPSPREEVMAAWLAVGHERTVVSHESALDLHSLSDVIPTAIHLSVPRTVRNLPNLSGTKIHTTTRAFEPGDVVTRDGLKVTSVARTIVDSAEAGTGPEQIQLAIRQAIRQGVTTPNRLEDAARDRSRRVQALVRLAMEPE